MDFLSKTGLDALRGADILQTAPQKYQSDVEYGSDSYGKSMKGVAQVLLADVGTRICYTQHGSFDTHTNEVALQERLLTDISGGIYDLYTDLKQHDASEDVLMLVFTEFGRRVKDNGNGSDHGSGGVSFLIGDGVKGGHYNEYPSLGSHTRLLRATSPSTSTSADFTPRYLKTGWRLRQSQSCRAPMRRWARWRSKHRAQSFRKQVTGAVERLPLTF